MRLCLLEITKGMTTEIDDSASAVMIDGFDREEAEARLIELLAEANTLALWLGYPPFVLPPTSSFRGKSKQRPQAWFSSVAELFRSGR